MAVALGQAAVDLRISRRSLFRLLVLLSTLVGAEAHDSAEARSEQRKHPNKRAKGSDAEADGVYESGSKPKGCDRQNHKTVKKHEISDKRIRGVRRPNEGAEPVRPVQPVGGMTPATEQTDERSPIALGAYIYRCPHYPEELDHFADEIGRQPAIVMWYEQWGGWNDGRLRLIDIQAATKHGATPMITWDPWNPSAGLDQPMYRLANIARGHFDAYIDSWATALASLDHPMYLRFGHEMNGDWYLWCDGVNSNSAADYVAAWQYMHDRFIVAGATNVRWVWSPNIEYVGSTPLDRLYPGDAFVDWVGLDGYNWGTSRAGKAWQSFEEIFLPTYRSLLSLTSKPMMIAETASTETGGDKAAWIRQAFLDQLPTIFPKVRAVIWFHENKETDWRAASSPTALAAFQEVASSPYLQGRLE